MLGAVTPMLNKINTYTKSNSDISGKTLIYPFVLSIGVIGL